MSAAKTGTLFIGWGAADLTPDRPVAIAGQFHARVSEGVADPITATALALESAGGGESVVLVSCDVVCIPDDLRDEVRARLTRAAPDLDPRRVVLAATHTHCGPELRGGTALLPGGHTGTGFGIELDVMPPDQVRAMAADRIAAAIGQAWSGRAPGRLGYGLGHAVVGHNRRVTYADGSTVMYGKTDSPEFRNIEGYEDHSVQALATWDEADRLTGLVVNVPCPSQVSEGDFRLSADYWHETRGELRRRLGPDLFVLPQCSAAGDQSPHRQLKKAAEQRMERLSGRTQRQELAQRITDAVAGLLPLMAFERDASPVLRHALAEIPLPARPLTEADAAEAKAEEARWKAEYEAERRKLEADPALRQQPRWYVPVTRAFRRAAWYGAVAERYALQKTLATVPVEVHAVRVGDVAIATNPFEYYLDFGCHIQARSKAVQTFLVQLAGSGTYVPTARAAAGKSYGAVPASTPFGPEAGLELALRTVELVNRFWE